MYVDCDEVICSDGYIADENGNCVEQNVCAGDLVPDGNGDCVAGLTNALTPVYSSDDTLNPHDGMPAYDSNGVLYIYNSELEAWLIPELFTAYFLKSRTP